MKDSRWVAMGYWACPCHCGPYDGVSKLACHSSKPDIVDQPGNGEPPDDGGLSELATLGPRRGLGHRAGKDGGLSAAAVYVCLL